MQFGTARPGTSCACTSRTGPGRCGRISRIQTMLETRSHKISDGPSWQVFRSMVMCRQTGRARQLPYRSVRRSTCNCETQVAAAANVQVRSPCAQSGRSCRTASTFMGQLRRRPAVCTDWQPDMSPIGERATCGCQLGSGRDICRQCSPRQAAILCV